jgi:hypothetical protein
MTVIQNRVIEALFQVTAPHTDFATDAVIEELIKGVEQGLLTHMFVNTFLTRILFSPILSQLILSKMIAKAIEWHSLFVSRDYQKSLFLSQWCLLMVRMGTPPEGYTNYWLSMVLEQLQSVLFNDIIVAVRHNTAQKLAFTAFNWIRKARMNSQMPGTEDPVRSSLPLRRALYDDIHPWARKDGLQLDLDCTSKDFTAMTLPGISHFLTLGLRSPSADTTCISVNHFIDLITKDVTMKSPTIEAESLIPLYETYFDVIRQPHTDFALKVLRTVPILTGPFLQPPLTKKETLFLFWDNLGVPFDRVLGALTPGLCDTPEEAEHVFVFVCSVCTLIKEQCREETEEVSCIVEGVIRLLSILLKFKIRPKVFEYLAA